MQQPECVELAAEAGVFEAGLEPTICSAGGHGGRGGSSSRSSTQSQGQLLAMFMFCVWRIASVGMGRHMASRKKLAQIPPPGLEPGSLG